MEKPSRHSINVHFRRESYIPAVIFGAMIGTAALLAVLGPWVFEHL